MNLAGYNDYVDYARQHFEEGLLRAGFVEKGAGWIGSIQWGATSTDVLISLGEPFPFHPPRVVPVDPDAVSWSWHRELDGALCLVAEDDHEGPWWIETPAFLEHLAAWFQQSDAGWPDDRPDLDLDRYFEESEDKRLYLYDDLTQYRNSFVRFRMSNNNTLRIGRGTRPAKTSKHKQDRFGYVADLGAVNLPPRTWEDISARIDAEVDLNRRIRQYTVAVVVLIYRRGTHDGAITLEVWPTKDGGIAVRRLRSGADTVAAKSARAGILATELHARRVAIVGLGALGSFIADTLVRSGVRQLTLIDHDLVMPGNLVRHLVGPDMVGLPKVQAVKQYLIRRADGSSLKIEAVANVLVSGAAAVDLLRGHDLVVNATADFATTALLHVTAESLRRQVLSAALQNEGASYRIDVLPPLDGAPALPPSVIDLERSAPEMFEAGCGSPVSPTPPHAVIEAAAATTRHAIGLLVKRPLHPSGETRSLQREPTRSHS